MRHTKIVCTIGPASNSRPVIARLLKAGMNVARLNFSHGTHAEHADVIALLREEAERLGKPIAILQDLCGPKVRLGVFMTPAVLLEPGQNIGLTTAIDAQGHYTDRALYAGDCCPVLPLPLPPLAAALKPGDLLLLDDGSIQLQVTSRETEPEPIIWTRCLVGGLLKPKKGVTAPGVVFDVPAVTNQDLADLRFGLSQGIDWVAASYVRRASDLAPLRQCMQEVGVTVPVIAKIEKAEAVENLDSILRCVDGLMVARGDLGVEMALEEVPIIQKRIIKACNRSGKPVITATQMLESMIGNPRPTRAETTDVANAILDGTDAVMLSGETAAGKYPVEAVEIMTRIALNAESAFFRYAEETAWQRRLQPSADTVDAVSGAAAAIARQIDASAIVCVTTDGHIARKIAQQRPAMPIVAATPHRKTYCQLALTWGILPVFIEQKTGEDDLMRAILQSAMQNQWTRPGSHVVLTGNCSSKEASDEPVIKVHTIAGNSL